MFSCSSPLDTKVNMNASKEEMEEIFSDLDSNDTKLIIGSMIRLQFQGENIESMTYSEILENGKEWQKEQEKKQAEQKELAEKQLR